jgi:hypothetical protein
VYPRSRLAYVLSEFTQAIDVTLHVQRAPRDGLAVTRHRLMFRQKTNLALREDYVTILYHMIMVPVPA